MAHRSWGSLNTYRSVVDLGSGPKLLRTEFTILDPKSRLFDRIDVRASNWGDDPYSTLHASVRKQHLYDFTADYRNIAYFNYLPSYADPLLSRGVMLDERSFDIRRRMANLQLDLLPGNWLVPYLAYERSSGSGHGINTFVSDVNEYPVPTLIRDGQNHYRAARGFSFRGSILRSSRAAQHSRTTSLFMKACVTPAIAILRISVRTWS